jgi:hypothetical protein
MDAQQALDLIAELPAREIGRLWDAGQQIPGYALRPGLWLGRNGGMAAPLKWLVRAVIRRDYFAKLVLDGFGVNVRVSQDGSHAALPCREASDGVKVDLPFALTDAGLDYGFHVLGFEPAAPLQMRDVLRSVDFRTISEVAPGEHLERVGASPGEDGDGEIVIGYIAPLAVEALKGTPFGMVWHREATAGEQASARVWIGRRRLLDSGIRVAG